MAGGGGGGVDLSKFIVGSFKNFIVLLDAYRAEKVVPLREKKAPAYSFGSRTRYAQKDNNPGPNQYSLPNLTSSKVPNKRTMPSYSMTGRSKIGGFHEDMQKVCNFICSRDLACQL